jgi:hypothetical protein
MPQPIVYIDNSAIREGKLEQLEAAMKDLAAFVEARVPQLIFYGFFLNGERTEMTVVAIHPDSAALEFHLDVGRAEFQKFTDLIDLLRIDVYGQVSDAVLERLYRKSQSLGRATLAFHECYSGFARMT